VREIHLAAVRPGGVKRPPHRHQGNTAQAKGKTSQRKTADRFAVLNAFVDAGMVGLSKVDVMPWPVLYRDTRNGTAWGR
jgi:hypothetical protein